ncbi:Ubiquitin carboxyl-terminal hydrolase-related protein, partial [Thalictrum thalictroides]
MNYKDNSKEVFEVDETQKDVAMVIQILKKLHSSLGVLRQGKKIQDRLFEDKSLKVQHFWNSMSLFEKKQLLQVDLHDLLAFFDSKDLEKDIIMEAFSFAKDHSSWKVWMCCSCDEKFPDCRLHFEHVLKKHVGVLSQELQSVIPIALPTDWESMLCSDTWKPIDKDVAFPLLEAQGKNWSSSKNRDLLFCDDPERKYLLKRIQKMLVMLQASEFLAADHVDVVIEYALRRLQHQCPGVSLSELGLDSTYLCICFLDASELHRILEFLKILFDHSRSMITENNKSLGTYQYTSKPLCDTKDRIVLRGYLLCLHMNKNSISGDSPSDIYNVDDASATLCLDSDNEDTGQPNNYALPSWMFTDPPGEEKVKLWQHLRELRKDGGKELLRILQKNFHALNKMLDANYNSLSYIEALHAIFGYLDSELQDRRNKVDHVEQSFDTILRQLKKKFVGSKTSMHTAMLRVIPPILKNAQVMHKRNLTRVAPDICNLLAFEDGDETIQNFLNQEDTWVKEEIKRLLEDFSLKLMKNDSLIMAALKERERLGLILNPSVAADYQEILLPLLKLYIQAKLEKLVDENATEMPEVAKEEDYAGDTEL